MIDLTIGDLRGADIGLDLELAPHAVDDDLEMELAHALDDGLAGFLIGADAEGRILLRQAIERDAHLFLVGLRLRLDRDFDHRLGELHALQHDRMGRIAQRIAGGGALETRQRHDVAGAGFLDVFAVVGMHLQHAADTLPVALHRIETWVLLASTPE